MIKKRREKYYSEADLASVCARYGVGPHAASLLLARGFDTDEKLEGFLHPELCSISNPEQFTDMERMKRFVSQAAQEHRPLFIWTEASVDGFIALSICHDVMQNMGASVTDCLYGEKDELNLEQAAAVHACHLFLGGKDAPCLLVKDAGPDCSALITADLCLCERTDFAAATAPRLPAEVHPFQNLCLSALCAKVLTAAFGLAVWNINADLVFVANALSGVPLTGENRVIWAKTRQAFLQSPRPFLRDMFVTAADPLKPISGISALWSLLRPVLETAVRQKEFRLLCKSLLSRQDDGGFGQFFALREEYASKDARILHDIVQPLFESAKHCAQIQDETDEDTLCMAALSLAQISNRPALIAAGDNSCAYAASVGSFSVFRSFSKLDNCRISLVNGACRLSGCDFAELSAVFEKAVDVSSASTFASEHAYDLEMSIGDLSDDLAREFLPLCPFGPGNPTPVILCRDVAFKNLSLRGNNAEHFAFDVYDNTGCVHGFAYSQEPPRKRIGNDVLVTIHIDANAPMYSSGASVRLKYFERSKNHAERDLRNESTRYCTQDPKLSHPLENLHLPSAKLAQLHRKKLNTIGDLLTYWPRKYMDFRRRTLMRQVHNPEEIYRVDCEVQHVVIKDKYIMAICQDEEGLPLRVMWFHQGYIANMLARGSRISVCGKFKFMSNGAPIITPMYWTSRVGELNRIMPVYSKIPGMAASYLENVVAQALEYVDNCDYAEESLVSSLNLPCSYDAFRFLHQPSSDLDLEAGSARTRFDRLLSYALVLKAQSMNGHAGHEFAWPLPYEPRWKEFRDLLPYALTEDQDKCLKDMHTVIQQGKRLNALVQGDVGSGKTIVAFFMMLAAADNHLQACLAVPTEVLAAQHYKDLEKYADSLSLRIALLTGSTKAKEKKKILAGMADGSIDIVVGTHALFQEDVEFQHLGMLVIDEQHKFGVQQRNRLSRMEFPPHVISMSATPIPRTMAKALLGSEVQVENIRTKPAGRLEVQTRIMEDDEDINCFVLEEIRRHHQCYIVCPAIEESDADSMAGVRSVQQEEAALRKWFAGFPDVRIGSITGKMKHKAIAEEIQKFIDGETDILLSTTIVEVGVNVPNATVMVLKSSERFGLAQAHQLRGRVGRGSAQSYCILQTRLDEPKSQILLRHSDGFEIAREDARLRGTGSLIGTAQSGTGIDTELILNNQDEYERIRQEVDALYTDQNRVRIYKHVVDRVIAMAA